MKQETNNEMDLLLRRLGRRPDVFAPDAEEHLDVDELSAYAENVLPSKARARYTDHLADCSRCRELVVQLSASAGVVVAAQADKVSESGWRKFLAGLVSPMVLKYAAPALALIVVAAIGVVVLRRDRAGEYVSQNQPTPSTATDVAEQRVESKPQPHEGVLSNTSKPAESSANKVVQSKDLAQQPATPVPQGTPADVVQNAPVVKAPAEKPESQPAAAAEPPPPPTAAKVDAVSDQRRHNEDASRKQEAEVKVAQAEESKKNFEVSGSAGKRGEAPAAMRARAAKSKEVGDVASTQSGAGAPGHVRDGVDRDDKDSSAEIRSVAGRRFRKQGGVWIDTAYDRSQAITRYGRGSESYRSLIADEPAIKTIADHLDGEIIVVWKGRAYRIQ